MASRTLGSPTALSLLVILQLCACTQKTAPDAPPADPRAYSPPPTPAAREPRPCPQPTMMLELGSGVLLELVLCPAGRFLMGSPPDEVGRFDSEGPLHTVTVARPFYIGRYEVTQAQWEAVMGTNPSWRPGRPELPMDNVHWADARTYCHKASEQTGRTVRLPSEAEWEYACRAGTSTPYYFGDDPLELREHAWHRFPGGSFTLHVGGQLKPNPWGLYDVYGNAWEWCQDGWHQNYVGAPGDGSAWMENTEHRGLRVLRGGSWHNEPDMCRSAFRWGRTLALKSTYVGFRVVVEADE